MYVSEYKEDSRSPDPVPQVCRFDDPTWEPRTGKPPVELFLNAGPGRIPSDHVSLIQLCQQIGVALEPYIFQSNTTCCKVRPSPTASRFPITRSITA